MTALLRSGGPSAVTVDAVTRCANVARATLYRHFPVELGKIDRFRAFALLIGPLLVGRLSTLPDFDYHECAVAAVDGFLHVQRTQNASPNGARRESADA